MEKKDARFLKLDQLHERRKQVIRLHLQGIKVMQIVHMTGLSYPTVRKTIDLFSMGSWSAIEPALRGRKNGTGRMLNMVQEATILGIIRNESPQQHSLEFTQWTRTAVIKLIEREFAISLSVRTIGKYLQRWGCTKSKSLTSNFV